jgi:SpoIID/LytB domain protein
VGFQTVCPDAVALKVGTSVSSQVRALNLIASQYKPNAKSAVVIRVNASPTDRMIAGNVAALTNSILLLSGKNTLRKTDLNYMKESGIADVFLLGTQSQFTNAYVKRVRSDGMKVKRYDPARHVSLIAMLTKHMTKSLSLLLLKENAAFALDAAHFASRTQHLVLPFSNDYRTVLKDIKKSFPSIAINHYGPESDGIDAKFLSTKYWSDDALERSTFVKDTLPVKSSDVWLATKQSEGSTDIALLGIDAYRLPMGNRLNDAQMAFIAENDSINGVFATVTLGAPAPESFVQAARTLYLRDNAPAVETLVLPALPTPSVPANFALSGSGWGHGIGMSQWGAFAMAEEGKTASEILKHYFQETEVEPVADNADLWVNLHNRIKSTTVSVTGKDARWRILSAADEMIELASSQTATFTYLNDGNQIRVSTSDGQTLTSSNRFTITWSGTRFSKDLPEAVGVAEVAAGTTLTGGRKYRFGSLRINAASATDSLAAGIQVTNRVSLHNEYLYGIGEVSNSWPEQALIAQAIAARSFAYGRVFEDDGSLKSRMGSCDCMVYADIRDQNYVGYSKITSTLGERWKAAVDATTPDAETGLAVVNKNQVVQTFYAAATGGHTQNNEDVWGGTPRSFYRGVEDPWSLMPSGAVTVSTWSPRIRSQAMIASAFGLPNVVTLDLSDRFESGGIRRAVATSLDGKTATLTGEQFRSRIKSDEGDTLQSTWVWRALVESDANNLGLGPWLLNERSIGFSKSPALTSKNLVLVQNPQSASTTSLALASAFAGRTGSALLLTKPTGDVTRITKLVVERGYESVAVVGNIDPQLSTALTSLNLPVTSFKGKDEFELAANIAEQQTDIDGYVIANPEETVTLALAVSLSVSQGWPLLYSPDNIFSTHAQKVLASKPAPAIAVGSQSVMSDFALATIAEVKRLDTTDLALASQIALRLSTSVHRGLITVDADTNPVRSLTALSLGYSVMYSDEQYLDIGQEWIRRQSLLSMILNFSSDTLFVQSLRRS